MRNTPFFPAWRARLAPFGSRTAQAFTALRSCTLSQLETRFAAWVPPERFPKTPHQQNSRDRIYTQRRTFWCMLWQSFNPQAPGREVVRQLQALFHLHGGPQISEQDAAYCRARARLPGSEFPKVLAATARAADAAAPPMALLQGRPLKVVDGSTLTLPDTPPKTETPIPRSKVRSPAFR